MIFDLVASLMMISEIALGRCCRDLTVAPVARQGGVADGGPQVAAVGMAGVVDAGTGDNGGADTGGGVSGLAGLVAGG